MRKLDQIKSRVEARTDTFYEIKFDNKYLKDCHHGRYLSEPPFVVSEAFARKMLHRGSNPNEVYEDAGSQSLVLRI